MNAAAADQHWNGQRTGNSASRKWLTIDMDVVRWSDVIAPGAWILDLRAGMRRHALLLAAKGFQAATLDTPPEGPAEFDEMGGVATCRARAHCRLRMPPLATRFAGT